MTDTPARVPWFTSGCSTGRLVVHQNKLDECWQAPPA
jgi:hypothetical protein